MSIYFLGIGAGLLVFQYAVLLLFLKFNWKNHFKKTSLSPMVSVLIAARNEEKHLPDLLKSLSGLDYPKEQLEILIADDQSSDNTPGIVEKWAENSPNRKLISVRPEQVGLYQQNGKANALAILAKKAKGEILFFTDADCEIPSGWIREGLGCFGEKVGMVIGITQVKATGFFQKMQEIDWWNTLGIVKVVTDWDLPTTGLGNNMAIRKEAYFKCRGFEGIPHSLTEDLEISKAIRSSGYRICQQVSEEILVKTKAEKDWKTLLIQRKRWMTGAMTLSVPWKIVLAFQFLFFPMVLALIFLDWKLGLGLWVLKVVFQSFFLSAFAKKAGQKIGVLELIFFDIYQIQSLSLTILYYFWPGKVHWKARNYP